MFASGSRFPRRSRSVCCGPRRPTCDRWHPPLCIKEVPLATEEVCESSGG
jgi:hypothetical protein